MTKIEVTLVIDDPSDLEALDWARSNLSDELKEFVKTPEDYVRFVARSALDSYKVQKKQFEISEALKI